MLATCFIALLAGAFFGWVLMRGFGWLCVALLCIATTASANITSEYTYNGQGTVYAATWVQNGSWIYMSGSSSGAMTDGQTVSRTFGYWGGSYPVRVYWRIGQSPTINSDGTGDYDHMSDMGMVADGSTITPTWGAVAATNFFVSGCITNRGQLPLRFYYRDTTGYSEISRLIVPGDFWCVSRTNANPGQYWLDQVVLDQEGGTNFNNQLGPYPFYTNTPPPTGGTGSGASIGAGPNNPVGAESGAGSTNALTGAQYAAGISNMVNANYSLNQSLLQALARNSNSNSPDYSAVLGAIATNTATSTNMWGGWTRHYQDMTNFISTNFDSGYLSNAMAAEGLYLSNQVSGGLTSRAQGITGLTNDIAQATEQDRSVWMMPVRTNVMSAAVTYIDLNPMHNPFAAGLMGWFRLGLKFWIQLMAFLYIYDSIKNSMLQVSGLEGGAISRGPWASIVYILKQNTFWGALLASFPILMLAALDSYFAAHGGWVATPFSSAGVASFAGEAAPYIRAGIEVLEGLFPLSFALATFVFLLLWDFTMFGHVIFWSRLVKAIG